MKVTTFLKLAVAIISGDNAEATALKIQAKSKATLRAQIAVKTATTLDLEEVLQEKKDARNLARVNNGQLITDKTDYLQGILNAKRNEETAQANLDQHLADIKTLEEELALVEAV